MKTIESFTIRRGVFPGAVLLFVSTLLAALIAEIDIPTVSAQAGREFDPPVNLSNNPLRSSAPDIASAGSNVYVVWSDQSGFRLDVLFRRSTKRREGRVGSGLAGQFFEVTKNLTASIGGDNLVPRVAAAGPTVYVVWQHSSGIFFRRSLDQGATWLPPLDELPASLSTGPASSPVIAVAGPEVYVAWEEGTAPAREIVFRRSTDLGENFGLSHRFSIPAQDSFSPSVAAAGSNVYVAWVVKPKCATTCPQPEPSEIYLSRSMDEGASFEPPFNLSETVASSSLSPSVAAVGPAIIVAWQDDSGTPGVPEIFFDFSVDQGDTFHFPLGSVFRNLSKTSAGASLHPRVAAAGEGFSITWQDNSPGNFELFITSAGLVGLPLAILPRRLSMTSEDSRFPSIARTGSNIYLVWQEGDPGEVIFMRTTPTPGVAPENLSVSPARPSSTPNVAVDGSDVYVTWAETGVAVQFDIFFRSSPDGGATFSSPLNLSNNGGTSRNPRVAAAGHVVYLVWEDDTDTPGVHDIFLRRSRDGGASWDPPLNALPINLSLFGGITTDKSRAPAIAAVGSEVYVAWEDETTEDFSPQVFFRRSLDQGASWDPPLDKPPQRITCPDPLRPGGYQAFSPGLAVAGSNVYLIWKQYRRLIGEPVGGNGLLTIELSFKTDETAPTIVCATAAVRPVNLTEGLSLVSDVAHSPRVAEPQVAAAGSMIYAAWRHENEIRFRRSDVKGATTAEVTTWDPPIGTPADNLSMNPEVSRAPTVATAGPEVYVAWEQGTTLDRDIFYRRSLSMGATFAPFRNLSANAGESENPWLAGAGSDVYIVWQDDTPSPFFSQIFFRSSTDEGATFPSISLIPITSGPDLTGSWISLAQSCTGTGAGPLCRLKGTFMVINQGTAKAVSLSLTRFYLSSDVMLSSSDRLLQVTVTNTLNPAQIQSISMNTLILPIRNSASGKFVIAVIDATNVVPDVNRENNTIVFGPLP